MTKNFILDENTLCLYADEVSVTQKHRRLLETVIKKTSFPLQQTTPQELAKLRSRKTPAFILKKDGKLYYSKIPQNTTFSGANILGNHICAGDRDICHRLSAREDEEGGCARIRDVSVGSERYPWITASYETINTRHDCFVVIDCSHYKPHPPRISHSPTKTNQIESTLPQFLSDYDD